MGELSERAAEYVGGPAWEPLRDKYFKICDKFLAMDANSKGELTTIYVKLSVFMNGGEQVFAVIWLRSSKQLLVGMALPETTTSRLLTAAPKGCTYKGLTKYLTIFPDDPLPLELDIWAKQSYENVVNRTTERPA